MRIENNGSSDQSQSGQKSAEHFRPESLILLRENCSVCGSPTVDLVRNRVVTQQCTHCLTEFYGGVKQRGASS